MAQVTRDDIVVRVGRALPAGASGVRPAAAFNRTAIVQWLIDHGIAGRTRQNRRAADQHGEGVRRDQRSRAAVPPNHENGPFR
jgi:hypothetical protein